MLFRSASPTPPASPNAGDAWFDSSSGAVYVYYDNYWVEVGASPIGPTGPTGPTGPIQQVWPVVLSAFNHARHTGITVNYDNNLQEIILVSDVAFIEAVALAGL